ncbi:MAG: cation:dicarboxylase symporter family transporter, partial [Lutibacter sp.]|nr:cation:dicarboxylase symporter family transporter [Lutibacter sp.]
MVKIQLHWQIAIALVLGIVMGLWLPQYVKYISWMGDLFMRALKMVIIPLILTSIISGIVN